MTWQGSLLTGYIVTSYWEGGGTSYAASHDVDGHLHNWSAAALGAIGSATQQFNETYSFSLENIQSVTATTNLGLTKTSSYAYDATFRERATSISVASTSVADYFDYDRRGRGLITAHRISATQNPPQDSYEYDVDGRLISISQLGAKLEDIAYGPDGELVARQFPDGTARYYVGDHMTVVRRATTTIGYAHIYVGSTRIASVWSKSNGTSGTIYYHRNEQHSVVATTTANGQVGINYRYLPSGAIDKTIGTEADENASELGFTGGLKLSSGLVHLKARVYSPVLRRFLQPDTLDLRRYTYVRGDPVNFVDPSGRDICAQRDREGTIVPCHDESGRNGSSPNLLPEIMSGLEAIGSGIAGVAGAIGNAAGWVWDHGGDPSEGIQANAIANGLAAASPAMTSGGGTGGGPAAPNSTGGGFNSVVRSAYQFASNHPVAFWAGSLAVGAAAAAVAALGLPAVVGVGTLGAAGSTVLYRAVAEGERAAIEISSRFERLPLEEWRASISTQHFNRP